MKPLRLTHAAHNPARWGGGKKTLVTELWVGNRNSAFPRSPSLLMVGTGFRPGEDLQQSSDLNVYFDLFISKQKEIISFSTGK